MPALAAVTGTVLTTAGGSAAAAGAITSAMGSSVAAATVIGGFGARGAYVTGNKMARRIGECLPSAIITRSPVAAACDRDCWAEVFK